MTDETPINLLAVLYPQRTATSRPGAWLRQRTNEVVALDENTNVVLDPVTGRLERTFRPAPGGK